MKLIKQDIEDLYVIKNDKYLDSRGVFYRNFCCDELKKKKIKFSIKQGNISINNEKHTLRGFHFQKKPSKESKIITVVKGKIYNVVIDLRKKSKSFLKHVALEISADLNNIIIVPTGCANAFLTLEKNTIIHYYMSDYFKYNSYMGFRYDDEFFKVKWPHKPKLISERDLNFIKFSLNDL